MNSQLQLGDMHSDEYTSLSEWQHFVNDEAQARGIDLKDEQAMEELDEELQEQAQDHRDHLEAEAYEDSIGH